MAIKGIKINNNSIQVYQKPLIMKQSKMIFPIRAIENNLANEKVMCRQCSSCHGCR